MILNGFLRGAHDPEIVANIDNKAYAGVATDLKNFIGTKRGALSKRAPFVMRRSVTPETYCIPYIYDQDQRYLLMFEENTETGKAQYRLANYYDGSLTDSTVGNESAVIQPTFNSDSQDGFVCSQFRTIQGKAAYQRFNTNQPMTLSEANGYWIRMKFPQPMVLSKLTLENKKVFVQLITRPFTSYRYYHNVIQFIVQGSNDGNTWTNLTPSSSTSPTPSLNPTTVGTLGSTYTINTYSGLDAYLYYRIFVTGTSQQTYNSSNECNFGDIKLEGLLVSQNLLIQTPYTMAQIRELHWANENKRMVFFHPQFKPHEIRQTIQELQTTGLDYTTLGNPTFGCFYQERLCMGGFTNANRQFNLSKSNPNNNTQFNFTLPNTTPVATDPMQLVIRRAKYPLREVLSGRNILYLQCIDGLATISSGGDEIPLTATQVSAELRNITPFSDIPAVHQEEIAFLIGSDYKTVYAMDFDYNVMRVRTLPINEHCLSYFESGIAQMITMKGQMPYIVFRLNNGKVLVANTYRTERGFEFHLFPLELADGFATCIVSLMNNQTGFDTLFAVVQHSNGLTTLESLESTVEQYSAQLGRNYFLKNIMLDTQTKLDLPQKTDYTVVYTGVQSETGRVLLKSPVTTNIVLPVLPDNEIRFVFRNKVITCKNCIYEDIDIWADVSEEPPLNEPSIGYMIPQRTWALGAYQTLPVVCFDGDDILEKESEDEDGNVTFTHPIYNGTAGLIYVARAQFENVADANVAAYNKVITNIAASITYGTGIKLGTESQLEKVGYTNYGLSKWQDYVLADESLKNIPLADTPRKDKKIVVECDYPFPANITFVVYDIKATGVR